MSNKKIITLLYAAIGVSTVSLLLTLYNLIFK